jgi:hypothetical protein
MKSLGATLAVLSMMTSGCASRHMPALRTSSNDLTEGVQVSESYETGVKIGDRCFTYRVTDLNLANTPEWDPESERPPISLRQAIDISRLVASDVLGDPKSIKVQTIALQQNSLTERWFYVIGWRPMDVLYRGDTFNVVILMNGNVVNANPVSCSDPDYYWSIGEPVGDGR